MFFAVIDIVAVKRVFIAAARIAAIATVAVVVVAVVAVREVMEQSQEADRIATLAKVWQALQHAELGGERKPSRNRLVYGYHQPEETQTAARSAVNAAYAWAAAVDKAQQPGYSVTAVE